MASENEALLMAVMSQLGGVGKLDYDRLAQDIGCPTAGAAAKRWSRFQKKLKENGGDNTLSPSKPAGVKKSQPKSAAKKPATKKNHKLETFEDGDEDEPKPTPSPTTKNGKKPSTKKPTQAKIYKEEDTDEQADDEGQGGEVNGATHGGEDEDEDLVYGSEYD